LGITSGKNSKVLPGILGKLDGAGLPGTGCLYNPPGFFVGGSPAFSTLFWEERITPSAVWGGGAPFSSGQKNRVFVWSFPQEEARVFFYTHGGGFSFLSPHRGELFFPARPLV